MSELTHELHALAALRRLALHQAESGNDSIQAYLGRIEANDFSAAMMLKMAVYDWFISRYGSDCMLLGLALEDCAELGIDPEDWHAYSGAEVACYHCHVRLYGSDATYRDVAPCAGSSTDQ